MRNKWNTDSLHKIIHLLTNFIFNFMDVAGIDGLEHGSEGNKQLGGVSKSMLTLNEAIIDVKKG